MTENIDLRDRTAIAILEGAAKAFNEKGENASMGDVALFAGVGRATLYRYFPNRDSLLLKLHEVAFNDLGEELRLLNFEGVSFQEALSRIARSIISLARRHSIVLGNIASDTNKMLAKEAISPTIKSLIADRYARREIDATLNPETITYYLWGLLGMSSKLVAADLISPEDAAALVARIFVKGVSA
ncbi:MAG: TetR/AcrR family transcriptional regulator [Actinomycetota bacterium]|nr:TetR/AcrR family transcriptional regulator [Actinomycetota bacterium]